MARNCGAAALQSNGVRRCFREVGSVRDDEQARWLLLVPLAALRRQPPCLSSLHFLHPLDLPRFFLSSQLC